MKPRERFLTALAGGRTDRPSVGNAVSVATVQQMRLTGCYFPEAHLKPEVMVGLARAGREILGYDTLAPIFSVQHEAEALGCTVDWGREDLMPEAVLRPCREPEDIKIPPDFLQRPSITTVLEALRRLRADYGREVALVGKVFGPWTLAYHLFGVESFLIMTLDFPAKVHEIMRRLKEVPVLFGQAQLEAGADVLTLGDHATGELCSPHAYRDFLMPIHRELVSRLPCPLLLHICGDTADRLDHICHTNVACFHFESRVEAKEAVRIVNRRIRLMGNINNPTTLLRGRPDQVRQEARAAWQAGVDILAPECAVPLTTPTENLRAIVEEAQSLGRGL
jgi:[methyl-Co(III) methanol-specific corrinoid protein]:coenzyme M methyltransferase